MTIGDMLVLGVLGLIVGSIIGHMVRGRKQGKHCGCGGCEGCGMASSCTGGSHENGCPNEK